MNLPKDFEAYFRERWRAEDVDALISGLGGEPQVSIRLNERRLRESALHEDFRVRGADGRVPWCPEGVYLKERPAFTADPLLHAGAYYVQEASSMFLAHVLRSLSFTLHSSLKGSALDLCAAPGGKSTLLRSLLPDACLLVSNEPVRARAQVLAENISKWGHPNVLVTQAYAADIAQNVGKSEWLPQPFDLILADVPCSGEGMMRKEEEAVRQWSPDFVAECAALQRSIVADIWPALRPGGILIYSTCTFNPEEDEENVEWIVHALGADVIEVPVDPAWGIKREMRAERLGMSAERMRLPCYHFLPGQVRGEGFFLAVLRKHADEPDASPSAPERMAERQNEERRKDKRQRKETRKGRRADVPLLNVLPTDQLESEGAPRVELSLDDAVRYLQREALVLPADTPKGIVQVCYRGQRLGLMKNLGTRANNLYPKEWRIRSSFVTPESIIEET